MNKFYRAASKLQSKYSVRVEWAPILFGGSYVVDGTMANNLRDAEKMARKFKRQQDKQYA